MDEYINRESLMKRFCERCNEERSESPCEPSDCFAREVIKTIPSSDVAPVRHGRWIMKHKHRGGFRRYTGIDDMGEQHTITADERVEYDDRYCSECGKQSADNFLNYCPNCGAKIDLEG